MEAQRNGGKLIGVSTGIFDLDEALGGFHDSGQIIVGAHPAMGKTGFLLGVTAAFAKGGAVELISGEQPADQVGVRWLAASSGVYVGRLRAGKFRNDDVGMLLHAAEQYGALPVRIHDRQLDARDAVKRLQQDADVRCETVEMDATPVIAAVLDACKSLLGQGARKVLAGVLPAISTIPVKRAASFTFEEME